MHFIVTWGIIKKEEIKETKTFIIKKMRLLKGGHIKLGMVVTLM